MGSGRLAVMAVATHAHHNHTQPEVTPAAQPHYNVNALFVSATLCGVLVAVCAGCWRRAAPAHKPDERCRGIYTISADERLPQIPDDIIEPPPAYDSVVHGTVGPPMPIGGPIGPPSPFDGPIIGPPKDCLQEVVTEACDRSTPRGGTGDRGLPSYEAAVLLRDTKL